ncbi:MAG: acyltransferase [Flavobacteriales bacterium]|nr:acyltransferase [Flavobacteriales bacterium]
MTPTDVSPSGRIFGLDLFRAVAILLVVLRHGGIILGLGGIENPRWLEVIDGVDLFFVLSGFLIGTILLKELHRREGLTWPRLARFWKRRWLRTLPNYYLILAANVVVVKLGIVHQDIHAISARFLVFMQNWNSPFTGFFWESWSLSVEEWFYLITPLAILMLLGALRPKWSFLAVTVLMLAVPMVFRYQRMDPALDEFWSGITIGKVVVTRLDSIAYGLLAAWTCFHYRPLWDRVRIPALAGGALLVVFLLVHGPFTGLVARQVLYWSIVPVAAMLLLPAANSWRRSSGPLGATITHTSKISYSMYLINLGLVACVIRDQFPPVSATDAMIKYVLFWAVVVGVSSFLYRYFELPVLRLREKRMWL